MQYYKQINTAPASGNRLYRLPLSLFLSVLSFSSLQAQTNEGEKGLALTTAQALPITQMIPLQTTQSGLLQVAGNDIRIVLRDSESGQPIAGARVLIAGQDQIYRTNEKGELVLPLLWGGLNCLISIEANGYISQHLRLTDGLNNDQALFLDKPDRTLKGQLCNDAGLNKGYWSPVTQPEIKGVLKLAGKTETGELPFGNVPGQKNK